MEQRANIELNIERITTGPKHHLFGFHDLLISNKEETKYLCIEVDTINRPPMQGELFSVGYVENGNFIKVGNTTALNYPQGARQQWVADTNLFTVNNRVGDVWGTDLYDASTNKLLERFTATTHMLSTDGEYSFGLDYARLFRLGGYGYSGILDKGANDALPSDSGITIMNMKTKVIKTLVSVKEVAECGATSVDKQSHHYLTHLCLNPSSTRLAFLHRYFFPDGGMMTRLMTIGVDGKDLRCLGQGFLSHFDWKDDNHIYIYGRSGRAVDTLRSNPILSHPLLMNSLRLAKKIVKSFVGKDHGIVGGMSFLMVEDSDNGTLYSFAKDLIPTDGHPMTNPISQDWCICDNYPDKDGYRDLFLYHFKDNKRIDLGRFQRIFDLPDMTLKDEYFRGVDRNILESISEEDLAFTRSGLHCDLHPRWSADGKWAVFDSIHDGTRQIYRVNVQKILA